MTTRDPVSISDHDAEHMFDEIAAKFAVGTAAALARQHREYLERGARRSLR